MGREKIFYMEKTKKEISYEKAEKKSWRVAYVRTFLFFSFQIRQQNKQKREHKFFFHTTSFLSPVMSIIDEYESLEVIGKGSFGTVRRVRHKDGQILVRKEIEYTSMTSQERNHIISELRILRELDHPHIVKYYRHDHIPEKKMIHIYMEYCEGGDLAKVIKNFRASKSRIPEEFVWQVLVQVLLALYRCHYGVDAEKVNLFKTALEPKYANSIIHRDIKPDNIFVGSCIKLGILGWQRCLVLTILPRRMWARHIICRPRCCWMIRIRQCVIFGRWGVCCMSCARWSLHSRRRVIYNCRPRLSVG